MKKLIVTAIGAAAALGAFATDVSTQRFKTASIGDIDITGLNTLAGGTYWFDAGLDASNNTYTVTNTAASLTCPLPFGEQPERALDITTDFGTPLGVNIKDGGTTQNIGDGFYFDSLVKFTVCDDDQSVDYDNAKIALWLQENTDPEDDAIVTTNIMVKAGYLSSDGLGGLTASGVVYKCQSVLPSFAESWHRVTIKVLPNITDGGADVPGFVVFIDGSNSTYDERPNCSAAKWDDGVVTLTRAAATYENALFPSMDQSGTKSTLTAVEYAGTGSLTDLKFTDVAPDEFAEDPVFERAPATITVDGVASNFNNIGELMTAVNAVAGGSTVTIDFIEGTTLAAPLVFTTAADVTLDFKGFIITNTQEFAAITNASSNLTITDSVGNGGIYCTLLMEEVADTYAFVAESGSKTTIEGGIFRGLINYNDATATVSGGAYVDESFDGHLAEGKTYEERDDLIYVVDAPEPTEIAVPTEITGLTYDGTEKTGVLAGTGYTITGNIATNAGNYTATATLEDGYVWSDTTTEAKSINWSIAAKSIEVSAFTLTTSSATLDAGKTTVGDYTAVQTLTFSEGSLTENTDYTVSGLDVAVAAAGDYTVSVAAVANGNYTFTTATATLTVTSAGGSGVEPGSDDGETYNTQADAEAAAAGVTVAVPAAVAAELDGEQQATYAAMFEPKVVNNGDGTYSVKVDLKPAIEAEVQTAVDAATTATLEDVLEVDAGETTGVTVTTKPGLYYAIATGTSLPLTAPSSEAYQMATGTTKTINVTKPNTGTAFFKVYCSETK